MPPVCRVCGGSVRKRSVCAAGGITVVVLHGSVFRRYVAGSGYYLYLDELVCVNCGRPFGPLWHSGAGLFCPFYEVGVGLLPIQPAPNVLMPHAQREGRRAGRVQRTACMQRRFVRDFAGIFVISQASIFRKRVCVRMHHQPPAERCPTNIGPYGEIIEQIFRTDRCWLSPPSTFCTPAGWVSIDSGKREWERRAYGVGKSHPIARFGTFQPFLGLVVFCHPSDRSKLGIF